MSKFTIFLSNRLEVLYKNFKKNLFHSTTEPFTRRLVIVYGPAMKNWLTQKMAMDPDLGIATGIEFIYLNETFEKLCALFQKKSSLYFPSSLVLEFAIEQEILNVLQSLSGFESEEHQIWMPILRYLKWDLKKGLSQLSKKMEKRLCSLCRETAICFRYYGRFAGKLMSEWEKSDHSKHWQAFLWKKIYYSNNQWKYLLKVFQNSLHIPEEKWEVYLFSISFINQMEFHFLQSLSHHIPVYHALLSPCALFWSDIRSDKESRYLQKYWQTKVGSFSSEIIQLEEILRERNPLLANFGRLGREMAISIEENNIFPQAHYQLPSSEQSEENLYNEDIEWIDSKHSSLLQIIQADILLLRNPQHKQDKPQDNSIQLHIAHNKRREIEILYQNILSFIHKNSSIQPADIIVLAPQVLDYIPFIQSIFGAQDSLLDYQISDYSLHGQGPLLQGFQHLINLSESRWDIKSILHLFENSTFQLRHHLTQNDVATLQKWIKSAGIRWGETLQHRNELLSKAHCLKELVEKTAIGTWSYGIDRLIAGLTTSLKGISSDNLELIPCEGVDLSQVELLGKWIEIMQALKEDLKPLQDQSTMTLEEWGYYLECLLKSYFLTDYNDPRLQEEETFMLSQFREFLSASKVLKQTKFSFTSIKYHLERLIQQKKISHRENHLQAVRFYSMMPLRSIPARVIALIGMQEGDFPRKDETISLNLAMQSGLSDYCPTQLEYDRYLFLEILHSAQDHLLISYVGFEEQDGKERRPSLPVEELFHYLDAHYTLDGKKVSHTCTHRHPFYSFDPLYFYENSPFSNYSFKNYKAALTCHVKDKQPPHTFLKEFDLTGYSFKENFPQNSTIEIKHLSAVTKNPLKFHLNKILGIYPESYQSRILKTEEDLFLSSLDKWHLFNSNLNDSIEKKLIYSEKEGKMPQGLFKEMAAKKIKDEIDQVAADLKRVDLIPENLFNIEFCTSCQEPVKKDKNWILPAITIFKDKNYPVYITGEIQNISHKGLVFMKRVSLPEVWKLWPQILLLQYASSVYLGLFEKQLLCIQDTKPVKSFSDLSVNLLNTFLDYYAICHKNFSPLLPSWILFILEGNEKGLEDKIKQTFNDFGHEEKEHFWLFNKEQLPSAKIIIEKWKAQAKSLLGDIIQAWEL